ncbi:Globoside alpha-1,3-N-acetylgalactosaminyltransferase 1 [Phlyctochytrium planicorne]|nr:Globoside alpha-1,3-N-acetylgalactosaminyltransferase 1 [Phlyctochytrium planicorne]
MFRARSKNASRSTLLTVVAIAFIMITIHSISPALFHLRPFLRRRVHDSHPSRHKVKVAWFSTGIGENYFYMASYQANETERYFCKDQPWIESHYFIFSDASEVEKERWLGATIEGVRGRVHVIQKEKGGWPKDSKERFRWMREVMDKQSFQYEYAYWQDADNMMAAPICEDMFGELVGAYHPHKLACGGPFEDRDISKAFVPNPHFLPYYSAHIFGGKRAEMYKLVSTCEDWTNQDEKQGIQAVVDDESYLNAYFHTQRMPTITLSRAFIWPDYQGNPWKSLGDVKAVAVDKNQFFLENAPKEILNSLYGQTELDAESEGLNKPDDKVNVLEE